MERRGLRRRRPAVFPACVLAGTLAVGAAHSRTAATVVSPEHYVAQMVPSHQNLPGLAFDGGNHFVVSGDLRGAGEDRARELPRRASPTARSRQSLRGRLLAQTPSGGVRRPRGTRVNRLVGRR